MRSLLVRVADDGYLLYVNVHHIAIDGLSVNVLLDDLAALYKQEVGIAKEPADLAVDFLDFVVWQRDLEQGSASDSARAYWQQHLRKGVLPVLTIPTRKQGPPMR
eukprot:scaffold137164_cov109-Phaeocystis_antarctica.AAC.1